MLDVGDPAPTAIEASVVQWEHHYQPQITAPVTTHYCPICNVPPLYCRYLPAPNPACPNSHTAASSAQSPPPAPTTAAEPSGDAMVVTGAPASTSGTATTSTTTAAATLSPAITAASNTTAAAVAGTATTGTATTGTATT
eukprot:Lankesteria_metandrocarpae@DN10780_c0_g1_i1.p1